MFQFLHEEFFTFVLPLDDITHVRQDVFLLCETHVCC